MDIWVQYNTQEDIEPIRVSSDLLVKAPQDDLKHEQYKKEWTIQQCAHSVQQYLCSLEFDNTGFQKLAANFPDFDLDYCKSRCTEEISTLLRWNYYIVLYFKEKGDWLKKAITLMIESSKLQTNELFAIFYLVMAFNLNKLYGCKQEDDIKEAAIWFVRNRQDNKFIYRCVPIVAVLEKSSTVRQEMLDVMLQCAEKVEFPRFENYLKTAINIAKDKKPVRDELARRYEALADEQNKSTLKVSYYMDAQNYFEGQENLARVAGKINATSRESQFPAIVTKRDIEQIEIKGNNNFERLKYLIALFKSSIPRIDKTKQEADELDRAYPLSRLSFKRIKIDDSGIPMVYSSDDAIHHANYMEDFVFHISYSATVISASVIDHEQTKKLTPEDYTNYLTTFGLHAKSALRLIEHGIRRHYNQDYISSIHVLIPQIENTLRVLLEQKGINVMNLQKPVSYYLTLFELIDRGTEILGNDFAEFLKLKLADPASINLRNRVCHGIYEDFPNTDNYDPLHDFSHKTSLSLILIIMALTDLSIVISQ